MGCAASSDIDAQRAARRRARQAAAAEREHAAFTAAVMASQPAPPRSRAARVSVQHSASWPNQSTTALEDENRGVVQHNSTPIAVALPTNTNPLQAGDHALGLDLQSGDASAVVCEEELRGRTSPGIVTGREPSPECLAQRQLDISTELYARGFNDDVDQFADEVAATDRAHRTCYGRDVSRQAMVHSWVSEASASSRDRSFD